MFANLCLKTDELIMLSMFAFNKGAFSAGIHSMSNNPASLFSIVLEKYVFDRYSNAFWKAGLDYIYYLALKNSFSNSSSKPKPEEKQMDICISQQSICIKNIQEKAAQKY